MLAHIDLKGKFCRDLTISCGFSSFRRQDKFLLFWVMPMLEPVIPSLNHITKLAQMRKKNVMQAFGMRIMR